MEMVTAVILYMFQYGVSLGIGTSTITIALWLTSIRDGTVDISERTLLHIAYIVLRVGMVLIGVSLLTSLFLEMFPHDIQYALQWTCFGVLVTNALLMTYHKVPMSFAPVLQGATWYALYFVTLLPIHTLPYVIIGLLYILWIYVVYLIIHIILKHIERSDG